MMEGILKQKGIQRGEGRCGDGYGETVLTGNVDEGCAKTALTSSLMEGLQHQKVQTTRRV